MGRFILTCLTYLTVISFIIILYSMATSKSSHCLLCRRKYAPKHRFINCSNINCNFSAHYKCSGVEFINYNEALNYECWNCTLPPLGANFTDSFFSPSATPRESSPINKIPDRLINSTSIGFANVNSLSGKFDLFSAELLAQSYDVYGIVETKIDSSISDSDLCIPGYSLFRNDRTRHGGGVAAYVRSCIPVVRLKLPSEINIQRKDLELISLKIGTGPSSIIAVFVYIPKTNAATIDILSTYLLRLFHTQLHRLVIIGDFNADLLTVSPASLTLHHLIADVNGFQSVPAATRNDKTLLDIVIIGDRLRHRSTEILPPIGRSDHHSLRVILSGLPSKRPPDRRDIWLIKRADWDLVNRRLLDANLTNIVTSSPDVNSACSSLMSAIHDVLNELVPRKSVRMEKRHLWMTSEILKLIRAKNDAYRRWKFADSIIDYHNFLALRRQCRAGIRKAKSDFIQRTFATDQTPVAFWSAFRRLSPEERSIPVLVDNFDQPLSSSADKAAALNSQFSTNFNSTFHAASPFNRLPPDLDDFCDYSTTPQSISADIKHLKSNSAPGDDLLTVPIIQRISAAICLPLSVLFNWSISAGVFPDMWKGAKVVPIPKPGNRNLLSSYRPISLLPILSKLLERHVDRLLRARISFTPAQHGFVKRRGTNGALISLSQRIHDHLDSPTYNYVCGIFLDIQKAFDKIPHTVLLSTLRDRNILDRRCKKISPTLLNWILSYLTDRSQFVSIDGCRSDRLPVPSGVPQGSILGPTLFISMIDPLLRRFPELFPALHLQAYADDLCLLIPAKSLSDISSIAQPALDYIYNFISSSGMSFNVGKSQSIIFRYNYRPLSISPVLWLQNEILTFVDSVKYLGITFTPDMKFSEHCSSISTRSRQMIGALRRKLTRHVDPSIFASVYSSCIRAVLDYGSPAWDPVLKKDIDNLERSNFYALRYFLNDWTLSYNDALAKASWKRLYDWRKYLKIMQFYKFYNGLHDYPNIRFLHSDSLRRSNRLSQRHHLIQQRHKTDSYTQSFEYSSISIWNKLSENIVLDSGFMGFKRFIADMSFE